MKRILSSIKKNDLTRTAMLSVPLVLVMFFILDVNIAHASIGSSIVDALKAVLHTIIGAVMGVIGIILSIFSGILLIIAGQFLDIIITFALNTDNIREIDGIYVGWQIFRDLVNMVFIFILLYVGISTIIQTSSFGIKKILVRLVLVALFVNFSFFFTGLVIDVGNVLAGSIYSAIAPDMGGATAGIGGQFIENLSISQFKNQSGDFGAWVGESALQNGLMAIMTAVFYFFASFALFLGASIFVVRHIVLVFILMLSPIAFAAAILDNTKNHWSKWVGQLMGATFVAPIYLLLIAITLAISESNVFSEGNTPVDITSGGQMQGSFLNSTGLIINYIIILGLIVASYTISKSVSGSITSISGKFAGKVVGASSGFAYRHTAGRGLKRLADSKLLANMESKGGASALAARTLGGAAKYGAGKSGDFRSSLKSVGIDGGQAQGRGGFIQYEKDEKKRIKERDKRMGKAELTQRDHKEMDLISQGKEGEAIVVAERKMREAKKGGDEDAYKDAKKERNTARAKYKDSKRAEADARGKRRKANRKEAVAHAKSQLGRLRSLDGKGYIAARKARKADTRASANADEKEQKQKKKREDERRERARREYKDAASEHALGTRITKTEEEEIYVDDAGKEVPKEEAKIKEAVYDGRALVAEAEYRTKKVKKTLYKRKSKEKDGSPKWTTNESHKDLEREKDGRQTEYRRRTREGTVITRATGDREIHDEAIEEAEKTNPMADVKEALKKAGELNDTPNEPAQDPKSETPSASSGE